jgi:hypothetical protein
MVTIKEIPQEKVQGLRAALKGHHQSAYGDSWARLQEIKKR